MEALAPSLQTVPKTWERQLGFHGAREEMQTGRRKPRREAPTTAATGGACSRGAVAGDGGASPQPRGRRRAVSQRWWTGRHAAT